MKNRLIRIAAASVVGLLIAAGIAWWQVSHLPSGPGPGRTIQTGTATVGGPFELVDHTGRTVTEADFRGRHMLVYFGFTFCPDVCPTDLQIMAQAVDALGPAAERVQPIFVTIDPERDTVEQMAGHVGLFHPRLIGLTGTPDQIAAAARAYRVYYAKASSKEGDPYYTMDHSAFVYLMGPDGTFLDAFPHGTTADRMAETIRRHLGT